MNRHRLRHAAVCPEAVQAFVFHRLPDFTGVGARGDAEDVLAGDDAARAGGTPLFIGFQGFREKGFRRFVRSKVPLVVPKAREPPDHPDMAPDSGDRVALEGVVLKEQAVGLRQGPECLRVRQGGLETSLHGDGQEVFRAHHRSASTGSRVVPVKYDRGEADEVFPRLSDGGNGVSLTVLLPQPVGFFPSGRLDKVGSFHEPGLRAVNDEDDGAFGETPVKTNWS